MPDDVGDTVLTVVPSPITSPLISPTSTLAPDLAVDPPSPLISPALKLTSPTLRPSSPPKGFILRSPALLTVEEAETGLRAIEQHTQEMEALLLIVQRLHEELLATRAGLLKKHEDLIAQQLSHRRKRHDEDGLSVRNSPKTVQVEKVESSTAPSSPTNSNGSAAFGLTNPNSARSTPQVSPDRPRRAAKPHLSTSSISEPSTRNPMFDREVYDWVCEITKLSDVSTRGWRVCYSERFLGSISEYVPDCMLIAFLISERFLGSISEYEKHHVLGSEL